MTRFARAKGSKSSNERAPEDSTPWEVMKEQLLRAKQENAESKNREKAEQQRIVNYENFLKEQKVQKRKAEWCAFPEVDNKNEPVSPQTKKKDKGQCNAVEVVYNSELKQSKGIVNEVNDAEQSQKTKKKKHKKSKIIDTFTENVNEDIKSEIPGNNVSKKKKKHGNKKLKRVENESLKEQSEPTNTTQTENIVSKKKKKHGNKKLKPVENEGLKEQSEPTNTTPVNEKIEQNQCQIVKKKNKLVNGQPPRRKPINDRSFQLIVNGKEVELVRFDGFPIMKKDAERLEELKCNMIKKGIPKSEVQRTLKLERRRAEKALARMKKDVCYNCRKGGHNLSDCPELKSKLPGVGAAQGVCFKCGSTEHRQFECKVQKDKEFRFATCFICKEPGHIARQCPDNPKGLYPNGGSCKLCGDVTHLRKDCPTMNVQKEETSIKLQKLDGSEGIEDIKQNTKTTFVEESNKKPKKIKF